jgi:hypothetical protein
MSRARLFGGFLVALALVVGVGPTLAASTQTKIVRFRVFTAGGQVIGVHVARTLRGSCFAGSIGLPRPDAWRCIVGNEILDPCLESPKSAAVPLVCVGGNQGVALRLTKPLPTKLGNTKETTFFAWRLVLADSDVCQRFTGTAAGAVQGEGLVYGCTSGGTTTEPSRAKPVWTVRYLPKGQSPFKVKKLSQLKLITISSAIG